MAKIGLPKGSGKWLNVREKSVKSQGILKWILSGNPVKPVQGKSYFMNQYTNLCLVCSLAILEMGKDLLVPSLQSFYA